MTFVFVGFICGAIRAGELIRATRLASLFQSPLASFRHSGIPWHVYLTHFPVMTERAVDLMLRHVLKHFQPGVRPNEPLFVGVQGPQGSGKTYLTTILRNELVSPPNNLSVALISIDDLYLPHSGLARVAHDHPQNPLLQGRGQPGTHDVPLGTQVLNSLRRINEPDAEGTVSIPIFDKSLHSGEGDRIHKTTVASGPLDVIIMEGWCTGFYSVPRETIEELYASSGSPHTSFAYRKEDVYEINELLRPYELWWSTFNTLIQVNNHRLPAGTGPPFSPLPP